MKQSVPKQFKRLSAEYFAEKAKQAKGTNKLLVALEMSNYIRKARHNGLSFEELKITRF